MKNIKKTLKNILKKNKVIYIIYFYIISMLLNIIGIFIKTDENLVLFVSYGGRRFDDSPKFLYEYMNKNKDYNKFKLIWGFKDKDQFPIEDESKVEIDTIKYFITALKAKYWITNSSIERGLKFKKRNTIYVNFQHGTAGIKKIGNDIPKNNKSFITKNNEKFDMFIIQGKKEKDILTKAFGLDEKNIYDIGLPRNDELVNFNEEKIKEIKNKLNIPMDKKVILYAPTYREYNNDKNLNSFIKIPFNFLELKEEFEDKYVLLITSHYEVEKMLNLPQNDKFIINAFKYPYINDLLLVSDILISDYSSVVFDYSILERPIICYAYDYDLYMKTRGTYADLNKLFFDGVIKTQKELIKVILNIDYEKESVFTKKIKENYIANFGNTTETAAKIIFNKN